MAARDSVEMIKEQLRMKEKELQRRDAEQEKHDSKIKHVLKLSQDKIEVLKTTVKKQEEEIKDSRFSKPNPASNAKTEATIKELKSQLETAHKEKDKLSENLKKSAKAKDTPAPAPKEVVKKIRDPKIVKALKKLKLKNDYLIKEKSQIQAKDDKEKELLNKEIKTLKKKSAEGKTKTSKEKTSVLEEIIQEKTAVDRFL